MRAESSFTQHHFYTNKSGAGFTQPIRLRSRLTGHASFTLLELLIVIGILAILAAIGFITINPVEQLRRSRDATRLNDLSTLNRALGYYEIERAGTFMGTSTVVYVSVPDTSSTCSNLGLPSLPSGYTYSCVTSINLQKTNGTGWVPVDFIALTTGGPISKLPIDPTNTTSAGLYYTYVPGGSWELNGILESYKYRQDTSLPSIKPNLPGVISIGNNLSLSPIYSTNGLVGYWSFDEGSGTTANDRSGNGNNGTLTNGPTWTTGKVGGALSFDGVDDCVTLGTGLAITGDFTIVAWVNPADANTNKGIYSRGLYSAVFRGLYFLLTSGGGNSNLVWKWHDKHELYTNFL